MGVYPRPRGEYAVQSSGALPDMGLPPPTRGIPAAAPAAITPPGSTPAHAGNTHFNLIGANKVGVYPRPRGEYAGGLRRAGGEDGLPPPTRGIHYMLERRIAGVRSTPAHAGNTPMRDYLQSRRRVYPRPRGEYAPILARSWFGSGLPPPTRGIHQPNLFSPAPMRSTPAHAGNTHIAVSQPRHAAVYPRPRGEYAACACSDSAAVGLPPPTRGILTGKASSAAHSRSTPAHAGNTPAVVNTALRAGVYPRPRGEYCPSGLSATEGSGLPPPTRGIQHLNSPLI